MSSDNFKVLNGLVVGDTTIIDSSGVWVGPVDPNIEASFTKANTATATAQAAFDKANTGGVQSVTANSSSRITQNGTQGAVTFDLATSGASAGSYTYPSMVVDAYGRTTSISSQTPVTSFNTRTGSVTLSSSDVTTALTFTPANKSGDNFTGAVTTTALTSNTTITINSSRVESTNTFTTSSTTAVSVDAFATTTYRSAKYLAQMTSGSSYHAIELLVIHNGTTAFMNEYGEVYTGVSLGDFEVSITAGVVNLMFTGTNAVTTIKLTRTALTV
jgi:hypothetical protein